MHALESQGHITPDELEQVGREFRTTHDIRALNRIFSSYILPRNGQPIAPILKLLGHPTVKLQGAYIYEAILSRARRALVSVAGIVYDTMCRSRSSSIPAF